MLHVVFMTVATINGRGRGSVRDGILTGDRGNEFFGLNFDHLLVVKLPGVLEIAQVMALPLVGRSATWVCRP